MPLVAGVDSSTQSCKVVVRDAETGALVRSGSRGAPRRDRGGPGGVVGRAAGGDRAGGRHRRCRRRSRSPASSTAWCACRRPARWCGPRCCGTTPGRPPPRSTSSPSWAARRRGRTRSGSVPVASFTVTKLRWLADPRAGPRGADRRGAACRTTTSPGGCAATATWTTLTTDRGDASGTGYWSPATGAYRPDLLDLGLGQDGRAAGGAGSVRHRRPGRRRPRGPAGRGARRRAPATTWPPRSASAPSRATWWCRSAPPARRSPSRDKPSADPLGPGGRLRRRDRPVPAAGVHAQRGPGAGRGGPHARRRPRPSFAELALSAPPGADGLVLVPYLEGERTPNLPAGDRRAARPAPGQRDAGAPGPRRGRGHAVRPGRRGRRAAWPRASGCDRVLLIGGGARSAAVRRDRARGARPPGPGPRARRVRRRRRRPPGGMGADRRPTARRAGASARWRRSTADPTPGLRERYAEAREKILSRPA